jgi:uncharacterized protein YcbX
MKVLSEIWIYPIKSLGGVSVQTAKVMTKGLYLDRRWMLVDEDGMFMTQRVEPPLALFKVKILSEALEVSHRGDSLHIPVKSDPSTQFPVKIWDDVVAAYEVDATYSAWFSSRLQKRCKLVSFPEENPRPVDPRFHVDHEHVSLADAFPYLVIGEASLEDLNKKLQQPVPMNRFRPNFVFSGGEPFEEDQWREFNIGKNRFVGVKPCARCVMTTVDQETASKGVEPLKTLARYRTVNNKVLFGQNAVAIDTFEVSVGDIITAHKALV